MPKILLLKGLPASGKTTFAKELCLNKQRKRVNKDDLRSIIDAGKRSRHKEKMVLDARDALITIYLDAGNNVVVDDTNINKKHLYKMNEIASKFKGVVVEVKEFDTPLHECLERDKNRANPVGADVITRMWREMVGFEKVEYDPGKKDCYIFDIDGTLATMNGRSPYDYTRVGEDIPNEAVVDVYRALRETNIYGKFFICSGRKDSCRKETSEWLTLNEIYYTDLYMRGAEDKRKDWEVKMDFYKEIVKEYNILGVFDDRDQVVAMRRGLGLTCFQVGYGNF